jgi:predicted 3-demethylubiquinone-9 3-methyltransferase (glyoxalase superfamily)
METGFVTCLWFDGQAEEAARYYTSIFPGSRLGKIADVTEAGRNPGTVLTVEFEANGHRFVALNGGPEFAFNEAISFQIFCDDQAEVDRYWEELTSGDGEESYCGWVKDRFGVSWQVIPKGMIEMVTDADPEKAKRATEAMLAMRKLDLETIRRAHAGD